MKKLCKYVSENYLFSARIINDGINRVIAIGGEFCLHHILKIFNRLLSVLVCIVITFYFISRDIRQDSREAIGGKRKKCVFHSHHAHTS